jgi:hypothetical protein
MKRVRLIVLALAAVCALSGMTASASMAVECEQVAEAGTGNWRNSICTLAAPPGEYIKINRLVTNLGGGEWCAETTEANTGNYTDSSCKTKGVGNFIKIRLRQRWQVNEAEPSANQTIKLQLKGTAALSVPSLELRITCTNSASENSTIEGQGKNHSGADKGSITYTKCNVPKPAGDECEVVEPIKTNQTKSHLAVSENNQAKVARPVDVFEPTEGKIFTQLKIKGPAKCPATVKGSFNVTGSVAAEIGPEGAEVKEGDLQFPEEAIKIVKTENGEAKVGLAFGVSTESTFSAGYGAQLGSGEPFGVGG